MEISIFPPSLLKYIIDKRNVTVLEESEKLQTVIVFESERRINMFVQKVFIDEPSVNQIYKYQCGLIKFINITSPFLVSYKGFTTENPYYVFMENMESSLSFLLERHSSKLTQTRAAITVLGVTKGLEFLHSKNILCGNLNTSYIYYDANGFPKIGKFGINPIYDEALRAQSRGFKGFRAPEVVQDDLLTGKGDIFSLGMIMYCISERTMKPFSKIRDAEEYLKILVKKNERPKFKRTTPELQKIIMDCWKTDPKERPTASDVLDKLMIYIDKIFLETNMDEIQKYLQVTESYAKEEIIEEKKPKPFTFDEFTSKKKSVRYSKEFINNYIEPVKLTYEESIIPIILSNCQHEYFLSCLQYCETSLVPEKSIAIIPIFISHFQSDIPNQFKDLILSSLIKMIQRDPKFVIIFSEQSLFSYLPLQSIFIGKTIFILQYLFYYAPSSILISYYKFFNYLFHKNPNEIMPLVHYFAYHSTSIQNPWAFFDILINCAKSMRDLPQGTALLTAFLYICNNNKLMYEARKDNLDEIFIYYINSSINDSVKLSYTYICKESIEIPHIDESLLLKHLKKLDLRCYVVSTLLRIDFMNEEIFSILISILEQKVEFFDDLWLLIYHISENQNAEKLFLSSTKWINACIEYPENGIKLITLLFKFKQIRELISKEDVYSKMFSKLDINKNEYCMLIIILLLHGEYNKEIINNLAELNILNKIISYGNDSKELTFKIMIMKLIQNIFNNYGYFSDFSLFVPSFIKLLTIQEYYKESVHVISILSSNSDFTIKICKEDKNVIEYFKGIVKYAQLSNDASLFLKNVQNSLNNI